MTEKFINFDVIVGLVCGLRRPDFAVKRIRIQMKTPTVRVDNRLSVYVPIAKEEKLCNNWNRQKSEAGHIANNE